MILDILKYHYVSFKSIMTYQSNGDEVSRIMKANLNTIMLHILKQSEQTYQHLVAV
jgi:hypothetical protein